MQPHAQAALRRLWLKQEQARCQQLGQQRPDDVQFVRTDALINWFTGWLREVDLIFWAILVV
jgi:hypothetical protein